MMLSPTGGDRRAAPVHARWRTAIVPSGYL